MVRVKRGFGAPAFQPSCGFRGRYINDPRRPRDRGWSWQPQAMRHLSAISDQPTGEIFNDLAFAFAGCSKAAVGQAALVGEVFRCAMFRCA